jgi:hypothetical protein
MTRSSDPLEPPDRHLLRVADANLPDNWLALDAAPPRRPYILQVTAFDAGFEPSGRLPQSVSVMLSGPAARALLHAIQTGLDWYPDAAPSRRERLLEEALRLACADLVRADGEPGDTPGDVAGGYLYQAEEAEARAQETQEEPPR